MSLYVVPATIAIWLKPLLQPAPTQRSMRYSLTPTRSLEAVQARLIWLTETPCAVSPLGAVGGVVSGGGVPPSLTIGAIDGTPLVSPRDSMKPPGGAMFELPGAS